MSTRSGSAPDCPAGSTLSTSDPWPTTGSTRPAAEQHRRATVIFNRWLFLIRGLVGSQGVAFTPTEERVINKVLRHLTGWTDGASRLAPSRSRRCGPPWTTPTRPWSADCRYATRQDFFDGTRPLRDALGALCEGSLQGMFDTESTFRPDWRAPIQTLSLQPLHDTGNKAAVGIALMCLNSWGQGMRETVAARPGRVRLDRASCCATRPGSRPGSAWTPSCTLDSNLRLSRSDGDIQIVTYHKPSDPLSAGDQGSQAAQIAKDLLNLADVRILMGQDESVASELGRLLGLTDLQQAVVTGWAMQEKGRALWMVGDQRYKVQTLLTPLERRLTYTNDAIATAPAPAWRHRRHATRPSHDETALTRQLPKLLALLLLVTALGAVPLLLLALGGGAVTQPVGCLDVEDGQTVRRYPSRR